MTAHSVSLPLFNALENLRGKPADEALNGVMFMLRCLHLTEDIKPVVIFVHSRSSVDLVSQTAYGREIMDEVKLRSEFLPCPEGECEYDESRRCRWCGKMTP